MRENILVAAPIFSSGVWPRPGSRRGRGSRPARRSWRDVLPIAPFTIATPSSRRSFVLITSLGGENFYTGNNGDRERALQPPPPSCAPIRQFEHEDFRREASRRPGARSRGGRASDFCTRRRAFVTSQPRSATSGSRRQALVFFNDFERPDNFSLTISEIPSVLAAPFRTSRGSSRSGLLGVGLSGRRAG